MGSPGNSGGGSLHEPVVTRRSAQGGHLVTVTGVIDERFGRLSLADGLGGVVVVDLDQVLRITSFGVREWIRAVKAMAAEYCCFVKCRPSIVTQFNMVEKFGGRGSLLSFYAPYLCPKCGEGFEVLLDLRHDHERVKAGLPPDADCPTCHVPAEFDDIPADYFAYAAAAPRPAPPPMVDALLGGTAGGAPPFRVEKQVVGTVTALSFLGELNKAARLKRVFDGLEGNVVVSAESVTAVTPEGLASLKVVLDAEGPTFFLARMPLVFAAPLARDSTLLGRATAISVWLGLSCPKCSRQFEAELVASAIERMQQGDPGPCCHNCGTPSFLARRDDLLALKGLELRVPSVELAGYLAQSGSTPAVEAPGGQHAFGRYELLRRIGTGGMAEVFLARQRGAAGFEKKMVVKRILPHLAAEPTFVSMLLQEARLAARISHPNVVQTYDVGQADGGYYIAMEYVKGFDLSMLLRLCARLDRPFPIGLGCRLMADVCAGLHAAHSCVDDQGKPMPIVHRDVSPHNVMVSTDGQVKLSDFGIAKAADSTSGSRTPTATLKGKISYLAPEQVNLNQGPTDARADIFACGLILVQCCTLEHPFKRDTELATLKAILNDPVPELRAKRPDAPEALQRIVDRALAKGLSERYPDAASMRAELEALVALTGQPATAGELAAWLDDLIGVAASLGQLPPETQFTPSVSSPLASPQPKGAESAEESTRSVKLTL